MVQHVLKIKPRRAINAIFVDCFHYVHMCGLQADFIHWDAPIENLLTTNIVKLLLN